MNTHHSSLSNMATSKRTEQRAAIKYCVNASFTPTETYKFISKAEKSGKVSRSLVFKWHKRFNEGRDSVEDDRRCGRPVVSPAIVEKVRHIVMGDRRKTIVDIAEECEIGRGSAHNIVTDLLGMRKVSARWVPRLLKDEERRRRVAASRAFIDRWDLEGDDFLNRIITCDETWIHNYDPETKQESMIWKTPGTPPPKKARTSKSAQKTMFIFFMDRRGMLLSHAVPQGETVNARYYQKLNIIK